MTTRARFSVCLLGVVVAIAHATAEKTLRWPQFRGPQGDGSVHDSLRLPERWSASKNVRWVIDVPGNGWSSPIVWGDRVFTTSAIGGKKEPSTGIFGQDYVADLTRQGLSPAAALERARARDTEKAAEIGDVQYLVYAFDFPTGRLLWHREAHRGEPFGGRHRKNTFASETPATDGERLYAYFGNVGLFCYTMDGQLLWTRRWEPQPMWATIGTASSPVVDDGRVYVLHDNEGQAFLAGVDAASGRELFFTPRTHGSGRSMSGWSTPFIWRHAGRTELVTIGRGMVVSYDRDGRELWRLGGVSGSATTSPVTDRRLLFAGAGSQGESNRPMFAIRPGASGDISLRDGESSNEYVAWFQPRVASYTPSPLVYQDRMYLVNDNGVLTVLDAPTGREVYKARVGGAGHTFSASPWASHGRVFLLTEDGETFVLEASDEYREVARNDLGEMTLATPAIAGTSLLVRTRTKLYRIDGRD
jgi:outer membrane protein assembly factor BamB